MVDAHMHCHFHSGDKEEALNQLKEKMQKNGIEKGILYLIDDKDYKDGNYRMDFGTTIIPAIALDPREETIEEQLDEVLKKGIKIIKILPYEQQILYDSFDIVCEYVKKIQARGMILTICGSYGSKDVYNTNGVELAAKVLQSGFTNPLIIAHGGMVRQLDTHSLMCEYDNLYFDISFTIQYWWGSHVIDDLKFVMEKCNYDKVFFGSDYPYHSFEDEIRYFNRFCEKYQISKQNREKILRGNFEKFYQEYLQGQA